MSEKHKISIFTPVREKHIPLVLNVLNKAMEKPSRLLHRSKRCLQPLATISEDIGETRKSRRRENEICQDCADTRVKEYNELLYESTHCLHIKTLPEDTQLQTELRTELNLRESRLVVSKNGHSKDINFAKNLFPEFFPRDLEQGYNSHSGLWAAKLTMEEVFSGRIRHARVSEKQGLNQEASFEYWKQYQLSF